MALPGGAQPGRHTKHKVLCATAFWELKPGTCLVVLPIWGFALDRAIAVTGLFMAVHTALFLCFVSQAVD